MSLSSALSNAVSGLRVSAISADVVGSNISNSLNEDYGRRDVSISQSTQGVSGGTRVSAITRASDPVANADWRVSNGQASAYDARLDSAWRVANSFGDATQSGSIQTLVTEMETQLISASSRPDVDMRLSSTAFAIGDVSDKLNQISGTIQSERKTADHQIGQAVTHVNEILEDLQRNNVQLKSESQNSQRYPGLLDTRDGLLDNLSEYMEVRTYPRENNSIAIYSSSGVALVEGSATEIEFISTQAIIAQSSVDTGSLNRMSINGTDVDPARLGGGKIEALFDIRDNTAVDAQAQVDALAYELATRLNDTTLDTSRTASDPGFLTDNGAIVEAVNIVGLSSRLDFNETVDPRTGGDARRLRDGVLGAVPGNVGNAALLSGLSTALSSSQTIAFGDNAGGSSSVSDLASSIGSTLSSSRLRFEDLLASSQTEKDVYNGFRLENSVDTDSELQKLLLIEQSYGANARVIQTIDALMSKLLEVV